MDISGIKPTTKQRRFRIAFPQITKQHYKNYFLYAYDKDKLSLPNITRNKI